MRQTSLLLLKEQWLQAHKDTTRCLSLLRHAVYDVTVPESFENLERIWMKEVDIYSNIEAAVKMVVANKVDLVGTSSCVSMPLPARTAMQKRVADVKQESTCFRLAVGKEQSAAWHCLGILL